MTHRRAGARHTNTHTQIKACTHAHQRWQDELGNSLRTPRQPDALPSATRTHAHTRILHNHAQSAPSVGSVPPRSATRDGRKGVCQRPLPSSQKGTQTQAREQRPDCAARGRGLSSLRTHGRHTESSASPLCRLTQRLIAAFVKQLYKRIHSGSQRWSVHGPSLNLTCKHKKFDFFKLLLFWL